MSLLHPRFFAGPWADVDPVVIQVWLQRVHELRPLFPTNRGEVGGYIALMGAALLVLPLYLFWYLRETDSGRRMVWFMLLAALLVYAPLGSAQIRFSPYAGILAAIGTVVLLGRALPAVGRHVRGAWRSVARVGIVLGVVLWPFVAGEAAAIVAASSDGDSDSASDDSARCPLTAATSELSLPDGYGSRPHTVAAFIDFGPEILYRTPHRVLAGPYHRNRAGILAAYHLLTTSDMDEARRIAREREVDLILLCPAQDSTYFGRTAAQSLYNRLLRGDEPGWIAPGTLAGSGDFRLFEVRPEVTGDQ